MYYFNYLQGKVNVLQFGANRQVTICFIYIEKVKKHSLKDFLQLLHLGVSLKQWPVGEQTSHGNSREHLTS